MSTGPDLKQPQGEVIYRRVGPPLRGGRKESQFDPSLFPLITGFAILLLLILVLGNLSVLKLEDTSRQALDLENQYAEKTKLLLQLRVALTQLNNEARAKMEA